MTDENSENGRNLPMKQQQGLQPVAKKASDKNDLPVEQFAEYELLEDNPQPPKRPRQLSSGEPSFKQAPEPEAQPFIEPEKAKQQQIPKQPAGAKAPSSGKSNPLMSAAKFLSSLPRPITMALVLGAVTWGSINVFFAKADHDASDDPRAVTKFKKEIVLDKKTKKEKETLFHVTYQDMAVSDTYFTKDFVSVNHLSSDSLDRLDKSGVDVVKFKVDRDGVSELHDAFEYDDKKDQSALARMKDNKDMVWYIGGRSGPSYDSPQDKDFGVFYAIPKPPGLNK